MEKYTIKAFVNKEEHYRIKYRHDTKASYYQYNCDNIPKAIDACRIRSFLQGYAALRSVGKFSFKEMIGYMIRRVDRIYHGFI
ncbi:hypothetical protein ACTHGU_15455 [Chitinophagaceae bacterium MMS25-I14]